MMLAAPSARISVTRAGSVPGMPTSRVTLVRVAAAAAACLSVAALSACASGDSSGTTASASAAPATTSAAPQSAAPESAASESAAPESAAPESAVPESAAPESAAPESAAPERQGPQYVADAILGELSPQGASSLTDQLVTIAMSPVTRQLTEELDLKAELKTKGDAVLLVISRGDEQCTVTASDPPRMARGVSCR